MDGAAGDKFEPWPWVNDLVGAKSHSKASNLRCDSFGGFNLQVSKMAFFDPL